MDPVVPLLEGFSLIIGVYLSGRGIAAILGLIRSVPQDL